MVISDTGCTTQGGAAAAGGLGGVVRVQFVNPATFADFRVQGRDVQYSTTVFTQEVTRTLEPIMRSRFPGQVLTLRFTDIDLAGRRSTGPSSVRIVRGHTVARLSFDYLIQDQSGRLAASGSQRLVDTAHGTRAGNPGRSSSLYSETRMLERWLRSLPVTH
jgi:hypothetical protein